jgi:hypothetical protein
LNVLTDVDIPEEVKMVLVRRLQPNLLHSEVQSFLQKHFLGSIIEQELNKKL